MGSDDIPLNFSKELDSTDCFILMVTWCNQFKFLVFGNIKKVSRRLAFIQANTFFLLKIKSDFITKIDISFVRPTSQLASISHKLWEYSACEWPLTNSHSFCLIILKLSYVLDGLLSVLSRLHGRKLKVNKSVYIAKLSKRYYKTLQNVLTHVSNYALKDTYMLNYGTIKKAVYYNSIGVLIDFINSVTAIHLFINNSIVYSSLEYLWSH